MTRKTRLALAGALFLALAAGPGCQTNALTGERQANFLSWEQQIELGQETAPELEKEFGGRLDNLAVQAYVRNVGRRVARAARHPELPEIPFEFNVLASDVVNAFALPGGPVYITRGMLEKMDSEGELAAVLGHECAHVTLQHSATMITRQMGLQAVVAVIGVVGGEGRGGQAAEGLAKVVSNLIGLKYNRNMESQADKWGLDYLVAAGYDPGQMVGLLQIFVTMEEGGRAPELLATHPNPDNRVGAVEALIQQKYPRRTGRVADAEYKREVLDRL